MSYDEIMKDGRGRMEKALSHLKDQMRAVRTGLASPALVENIRVDYYGSPTPISQLGANQSFGRVMADVLLLEEQSPPQCTGGNMQFDTLASHQLEESDRIGGAGGTGDTNNYSMVHKS